MIFRTRKNIEIKSRLKKKNKIFEKLSELKIFIIVDSTEEPQNGNTVHTYTPKNIHTGIDRHFL